MRDYSLVPAHATRHGGGGDRRFRPPSATRGILDAVSSVAYIPQQVEALLSGHFGNLRRLVIYMLYNCTNWQKFLSIPAIQKLVQLEIH